MSGDGRRSGRIESATSGVGAAHRRRVAREDETPEGGIREAWWFARFEQVQEFVRVVGRLPARTVTGSSASAYERSLFYWLRQQRKREARLAEWQWQRLDLLEGFEWVPREAAWERRLASYEAFVRERGREPRVRGSGVAERSLARWMERQVEAKRRRQLPVARQCALETASSWRSDSALPIEPTV